MQESVKKPGEVIVHAVIQAHWRSLGKQNEVIAVRMFKEFKKAKGTLSLPFPAVSPHVVPTIHPSSSLLPKEPEREGAQQTCLLRFPLCIPNLRGLSDGFSAQHLPLCLPGQVPVTSPERLHGLSWVSWPWNCKLSGPVQGGRLMVTEYPSQPQLAQQSEGPRNSLSV